jgi:hypothetical protein
MKVTSVRTNNYPSMLGNPRATIDIEINIVVSNKACNPILGMLKALGVAISITSKNIIIRRPNILDSNTKCNS